MLDWTTTAVGRPATARRLVAASRYWPPGHRACGRRDPSLQPAAPREARPPSDGSKPTRSSRVVAPRRSQTVGARTAGSAALV